MKSKYISFVKVIIFSLIIILTSSIFSNAEMIPVSMQIMTEGENINKVTYGRYEITAKKVVAKDIDSIGYCLEINKNYPAGENFNLTTDMDEGVIGIIKNGYPDYSAEELGLLNDDEAYFATQIALWCYIEKYNLNALDGEQRIISAINKIYEGADITKSLSDYEIKTYYTNSDVQDIIMLLKKEEQLNNDKTTNENTEEIIFGK